MIRDLSFWSTFDDTFLERDSGSLRNENDLQLIIIICVSNAFEINPIN